MAENPADWAVERADALYYAEEPKSGYVGDDFKRAFARYIEAHEEPPVDPLLVEAREIAAQQPGLNALQQQAFRGGRWDTASTVPVALAALRRGLELAERAGGQG